MTTTTAALLDTHAVPSTPALAARAAAPSRRAVIAGRCLSGFVALFLAFDAAIKLARLPMTEESGATLGYPPGVMFPLGVVQALLLVLYLVPRTAPLGAVLWTGYLGGAIATHVRVENPLFSHTLFPIYIAAMLWGGLWLRDRRVRGLLAA